MRIVAAAFAVLALAACGGSQASRPELQQTLDRLVATRVAPGVTAYVAGPKGEWRGAAGLADVARHVAMRPDDRLRLESVSKLWTAAVVLKLVDEHKLALDDHVEKWLPGMFPYGDRITVRQLLSHTSGVINNDDFYNEPEHYFAELRDPQLKQQLLAESKRTENDPVPRLSEQLELRVAAALPLEAEPGTSFHYSNIGYKIAALVAEKASGETMDTLYRRVIIDPLGLKSAVYSPGPHIAGEHPVGYYLPAKGKPLVATYMGDRALGAEGGIVATARDEAGFLTALMEGKVVSKRMVRELQGTYLNGYGLGTGVSGACTGTVYSHNGGGVGWASSVVVSGDGKQVAVLLLNGRTEDDAKDPDYAAAVFSLFCDA